MCMPVIHFSTHTHNELISDLFYAYEFFPNANSKYTLDNKELPGKFQHHKVLVEVSQWKHIATFLFIFPYKES